MALPDRSGQGIELSPCSPEDHAGLQVYYPPPSAAAYVDDSKRGAGGDLPWEKTTPTPAYTPNYHHTGYSTPPIGHHAHAYDQSPLMAAGDPPPGGGSGESRILGLKRRTFFIVVAIVAFVLVIGIATGVGVGVAMNGKNAPSPAANTTTAAPTKTRTLPLPLATSTTSPTDVIQCPTANLTLYASQEDPSRKFLVFCGRDYHSSQGTTDLLSRDAETMAQCIDYCATVKECVGAGWGFYQGRYVCWLKSVLGTSHEAGAWCFAVLDKEDV